jgi:hypothetical protein
MLFCIRLAKNPAITPHFISWICKRLNKSAPSSFGQEVDSLPEQGKYTIIRGIGFENDLRVVRQSLPKAVKPRRSINCSKMSSSVPREHIPVFFVFLKVVSQG